MAALKFSRTIDPYSFHADVTFNADDIAKAFDEAVDPDEDLFFELYGPNFDELTVSKQLLVIARAAELIENANSATTLGLTAAPPELKPR